MPSPSSSAAKKRLKPRVGAGSLSPPPLHIFGQPSPGLFPSGREELLRFLAVVTIAAAVAAACHYAATTLNRQPLPFCDSDGEAASQDPVSHFCESCPEYGHCSNGKLECSHGYRRHGRICVEDGEINQAARKFSELIALRVCDEYARVLCNETGKIWFQEDDIMEVLDEQKWKEKIDLKEDYFMFAKLKAMETVERSLETRVTLKGNKEIKCPDLLAELHKPLQCRIRQWLYRHMFILAAFSALLAGLVRFLWRRHQKHLLSARAEQLYEQFYLDLGHRCQVLEYLEKSDMENPKSSNVCEILEENALMVMSRNDGGEPWVVASWLRDHLLLPRERKDGMLWKKVEELVLEDSRIDQYPKLIKGESKVVLEWQDAYRQHLYQILIGLELHDCWQILDKEYNEQCLDGCVILSFFVCLIVKGCEGIYIECYMSNFGYCLHSVLKAKIKTGKDDAIKYLSASYRALVKGSLGSKLRKKESTNKKRVGTPMDLSCSQQQRNFRVDEPIHS